MTLEPTSDSDITFMQSLRESSSAEAASTEATDPEIQETATAEPEAPASENSELETLRRIVATDPSRRAAYEQEVMAQYGYAPPPPPPPAAPAAQAEPQLPISPDDFDLTNPEHFALLIDHALEQRLKPAFSYIDEQRAEDQRILERRGIEAMTQQQKTLLDEIEKEVPGYSKAFQLNPGQGYSLAEKATPEQEMLATYANTLFNRELAKFPQALHQDSRVHMDVIQKIAPSLKNQAIRLGVSDGKKAQTGNPALQRESYVENSNVAPTPSGNMFADALTKHDDVAMMAAIRKKV